MTKIETMLKQDVQRTEKRHLLCLKQHRHDVAVLEEDLRELNQCREVLWQEVRTHEGENMEI